ncbi:hypothetical protein CERZMDRAFT_108084 [Cercospora zeae-maydis SCOH1-5]|uniref:CFEM domain-containing protein n=1 Tax=Cercospora zeae-maydis SCOH1-5 TaxID=717836 RepID=A0A6A6EZB6_9PEZI|nr:hypothetical protein CERZMDRAFT_108084 [Cercospora zeae-maydis SCOH1-5]
MARLLRLLCLAGLAFAGLNEADDLGLAKRQQPASCASPGVNFLVNSNPGNPNAPNAVNYTVQCGSDTFGDNLYNNALQAPNGYIDCITGCEASTDCSAFTFVANAVDGTGTSPGNCYLKRTSCNQGVAFDRSGQRTAAYIAALRPYPAAPGTTRTSSSAAPSATRSCAASATPVNSPSNANNVYFTQCDIDTEGGLLQVVGNQPNYTSCFPLCDTTANCVGFTFTTFYGPSCPGLCYLKYSESGVGGLRFTSSGMQGTNQYAAIRRDAYAPAQDGTATATPNGPPPPPPVQSTPIASSTTTTRTSSTAAAPTASSICPGRNNTVVTDANANSYTLYCGFEYEGAADTVPDVPNLQSCLNICGSRPSSGTGQCFGVTWTGGDTGPGYCYVKTQGLYLRATDPNIICAFEFELEQQQQQQLRCTAIFDYGYDYNDDQLSYSSILDYSDDDDYVLLLLLFFFFIFFFLLLLLFGDCATYIHNSRCPVFDYRYYCYYYIHVLFVPLLYRNRASNLHASGSVIDNDNNCFLNSETTSSSSSEFEIPISTPSIEVSPTISSETSSSSPFESSPPIYTPPQEFSTTITSETTSSSSSELAPPIYSPPSDVSTTLNSASSSASSASEGTPPIYTPPIQVSTTISSETTSSSSSELSPPIYTPPVDVSTTLTSASSSASSSSGLVPPIDLSTTLTPSSSSELVPPIYTPPVDLSTSTSSSSSELASTVSSSSGPTPLSSTSASDISASTSSSEALPPIYTPPVDITTTVVSSSSSSDITAVSSSTESSSEVPSNPPVYSQPSSSSSEASASSTQQSSNPPASSASSSSVEASSSNAPTPPIYEVPTTSVVSSSSAPTPPIYVVPTTSLVSSSGLVSSSSGQVTFTVTPLPQTSSSGLVSSSGQVTLIVTPVPSPSTTSRVPPQITDIPSCARPCITDLGACAEGDVRCICSNQALLERYRSCVVQACTPSEAQNVVGYAVELCRDYGITALPPLNYPSSTASATSATTSRAPSITDIPECAQTCVPNYGTCAAGDIRCICSNQSLLEGYRSCVIQNCNAADAQATYDYASRICGNYGVTNIPPLVYPSSTSAVPSTSFTSPPSVTDIPQCAQPCVLDYGNCREGDVRCVCSNTPLLEGYRTCVLRNCNAAGAQQVYAYAVNLCGSYGVTSLPPLYPSSTAGVPTSSTSATASSRPASVTTLTPSLSSCIPCTRSTGSCVKKTTVIPLYSREL